MKPTSNARNIVVCFWFLLSPIAFSGDVAPWLESVAPTIRGYLFKNISAPGTAKGSVIASPSTENPNYFYHWVRDAGLVMDTVATLYGEAKDPSEKSFYYRQLMDYVSFSKSNQSAPTLTGLGEPKFYVDGTPFNEPWGRPQNDSPAVRAIALIHFANILLSEGKANVVRELLYDGSFQSVIKKDLEYLANHWGQLGFDVWEEISGHHFFTEMVIRRALKDGATLARKLNDPKAGGWYDRQAVEMESLINRHWDQGRGIIVSTIDRNAGADYKWSGLDSSVILGVIHGDAGDYFYDVTSDRVISTVARIEASFQQLYPINHNGHRGIAIGRYPEDRYDGFSTHGEGNPWFLTTNAFAQFYYEAARRIVVKGEINITSKNRKFFSRLGSVGERNTIRSSEKAFLEIVEALTGKGDDYIACTQFHMDDSGSISEQMNRHSGYMQGARDLTWSFASLLSAAHARPK